jgi:hypothetical protein
MEQQREKLDDPYHQMMMDMYTRSMDNTPPSRWWIGLGLVPVVLGGVIGLLLATGNLMHETPNARPPLVSTSVSQEGMGLPDTQTKEPPPAVSPPASGAKAGLGPISGSASTRSKALSARPRLMNQPKRRPACPANGCLPRVTQQRSIPRGQGSLLEEFDPNAVLVRSTP